MAEYTYEQLHKTRVADLREIAKGLGENEELEGFTGMHKEDLVLALCRVLKIEGHTHHEVKGVDKSALKKKVKSLKVARDAALESKDSRKLKITRRRIRRLKRKLRQATV